MMAGALSEVAHAQRGGACACSRTVTVFILRKVCRCFVNYVHWQYICQVVAQKAISICRKPALLRTLL